MTEKVPARVIITPPQHEVIAARVEAVMEQDKSYGRWWVHCTCVITHADLRCSEMSWRSSTLEHALSMAQTLAKTYTGIVDFDFTFEDERRDPSYITVRQRAIRLEEQAYGQDNKAR